MSQLPVINYKLPPFKHQADALEEGWDRTNFAYFMEMGTGKSKVLIDNAAALYLAGKIDAVILFAPKGVYMNWIDKELPTHWPEDIPMMSSFWSSAKADKMEAEYKALGSFKGLRWLCVNVEAVAYDRGYEFAGKFMFLHKNRILAAVDESTTIKNLSAKRTKKIIKLGTLASHRRILTGDPVPRAPTDLFSQCMFMSVRLLGYSSFYSFRNTYCTLKEMKLAGGRSFLTVTGYQRLEELKDSLKSFSFRVTKDECLDLPPKVYQSWDVELTKEQLKIYKSVKEDAVALLNDAGSMVTAPLAITQLLRLHQITCGHVKTDDGVEIDIPNNRLATLMEVLDGATGKVIIWATYRPDIKRIISALAEEYGKEALVHYYGDTSDDDRRLAINTFQNNPSTRFFVGNPSTGRYGITLTSSATVVYYSNSYDLEFRTQSEDRAHRIGQTALRVNYIDLVARGTVDEKIIKALRSKKQVSALINGDQWKEWIK